MIRVEIASALSALSAAGASVGVGLGVSDGVAVIVVEGTAAVVVSTPVEPALPSSVAAPHFASNTSPRKLATMARRTFVRSFSGFPVLPVLALLPGVLVVLEVIVVSPQLVPRRPG